MIYFRKSAVSRLPFCRVILWLWMSARRKRSADTMPRKNRQKRLTDKRRWLGCFIVARRSTDERDCRDALEDSQKNRLTDKRGWLRLIASAASSDDAPLEKILTKSLDAQATVTKVRWRCRVVTGSASWEDTQLTIVCGIRPRRTIPNIKRAALCGVR